MTSEWLRHLASSPLAGSWRSSCSPPGSPRSGGVVYAGTQTFVGPDSFNQGAELSLLLILFLGGRRNLWGAVIAAVGIEYLAGTNNWIETHLLIVEGVLFTLILLYAPNGVITLPGRLIRLAASKLSLRSKSRRTGSGFTVRRRGARP